MKPHSAIDRWLLLLALLTLNFQPTTACAQGTAFTYQGLLQDGSTAAGGKYDFRFVIYDSTLGGNIVAGPLTNTAVAVSNGLFTVVLDFGPGVFNGGARWLEAGVRSGSKDFMQLSPRQPVLPTPYALLAAMAASVASSNISGRLPDSILSSNVAMLNGSPNFAGAVTASSFAGNGSGLTNVSAANLVPYTMTCNQFDYPTWLRLQAASIPQNNNYSHGGWTNIIAAFKSNRQKRIELDGTGLIGLGLLDGVITNLTNAYPLAGYLNITVAGSTHSMGAATTIITKDGYGYRPYVATTNLNGTNAFWSEINFAWDVCEIDFVVEPSGGTWRLQTNNGAGGPYANTDLSAVRNTNATIAGKSIWWTNRAGPKQITPQMVSTSTGTNRFINIALWNSKITNGILWGEQQMSSSHPSDWVMWNTNISWVVYSNWAPDLILWESPEDANTIRPITNVVALYRSACPHADIILCGQYPQGGGTELGENAFLFSVAQQYNVSYFDGWTPFESCSNMFNRGLIGPDFVHATDLGYRTYGFFLTRYLGLNYLVNYNLP